MRGLHGTAVVRTMAVLLVAGAVVPTVAAQTSAAESTEAAAMATIAANGLRADMRFLADDALAGRQTASREMRVAAAYVAARFTELGLVPAGDDGTYFQRVPLHRSWADPEASELVALHGGAPSVLRHIEDFYWNPSVTELDARLEVPVVAVGFGVSAPELHYDDYAGVDVRGKIVLLARGAPETFPHNQRAYHSLGVTKGSNAVAHGAAGMLVIRDPARDPEPAERWRRLARQYAASGSMTWDDAGAPHGAQPTLRIRATLSPAGLQTLLGAEVEDFRRALRRAQQGKPASFRTRTMLRAHQRSRHQRTECVNVAALLPGSDPALRAEHVVYSAHLDHIGTDPAAPGSEAAAVSEAAAPAAASAPGVDLINNGAYDNASGIAAMLATARAFTSLPQAPRRSLLFVAVTGEEKGLLGAEYFAAHPPVERSSLVADFNLDMFLMLFPVRDIVAFGAEHSSLDGPVRRAAARTGFAVSADPYPEEVIFVRSDQYAFVEAGIPAVFLVAGWQSGDPAIDGGKATREWLVTTYHSPADEMAQPMDLDSGVRFARANFLAGLEVANTAARPVWNRGDFFGERFGGGRDPR